MNVEHTCATLTQTGQPVTFTAVAASARVGRATLYRDPQLRVVVVREEDGDGERGKPGRLRGPRSVGSVTVGVGQCRRSGSSAVVVAAAAKVGWA